MKKKNKLLLILSLLLMPTVVFASSGDDSFPIGIALFMEAFVSIHMSIFVLKPLSEMFSKTNYKKTFWTLFIIRAVILIFCDLFVSSFIAIFDFLAVFVGAFIIVPICAAITKTKIKKRSNQIIKTNPSIKTATTSVTKGELKCAKCGALIQSSDKFCSNCGEAINNNEIIQKVPVSPSDFDKMYCLTEDEMLDEFLNKELNKAGIDKSTNLIPSDVLKRKKILNIIFSVLIFVFITLIFFHFPIATYIIGIIILFIFFKVTRNYDLIKYLKKQLKARPEEKISNIVMSVKNTFISDNSKNIFIISLVVAVILPLIIFSSPRILYERVDGGYAVRYYIFGLTNFKTATIPEAHKNEKVLSMRGNSFSNMPFLKEVNLPDTITEIRGQAFKNDKSLKKIKLPKNLKYLGGGSFENTSIVNIEIPNSVTYIGGEVFKNATKLKSVKLSKNISEIRGSSFENCKSLKEIDIPDKVTRIGGHAFYGNTSLKKVNISENSMLQEIGSSAFRLCDNLREITIPRDTYVNERAFKESPTDVKIFGEFGVDESKYKYNSFLYFSVNQIENVNKYRRDSESYNSYITLKDIRVNGDYNEYDLLYTNSSGESINFTLTKDIPYKEINDDLLFSTSSDYVFDKSRSSLALDVYYN